MINKGWLYGIVGCVVLGVSPSVYAAVVTAAFPDQQRQQVELGKKANTAKEILKTVTPPPQHKIISIAT